jgi:hypothetical protein
VTQRDTQDLATFGRETILDHLAGAASHPRTARREGRPQTPCLVLGDDPQFRLDLDRRACGLDPQGGEAEDALEEAAVDLDLLDAVDVHDPVVAPQDALVDPEDLAVEGVHEPQPREDADDHPHDARDREHDQGCTDPRGAGECGEDEHLE